MTTRYSETDEDTLREVLIGRSITSVQLGGDLPDRDEDYCYERTEGTRVAAQQQLGTIVKRELGCSCGAGGARGAVSNVTDVT